MSCSICCWSRTIAARACRRRRYCSERRRKGARCSTLSAVGPAIVTGLVTRTLTRSEAAYRVVRQYFEIAGFGSERAVARLLAIDPALVDSSARRLERERVLGRTLRVEGLIGEHSILAALTD